jgi:hypothetical protein
VWGWLYLQLSRILWDRTANDDGSVCCQQQYCVKDSHRLEGFWGGRKKGRKGERRGVRDGQGARLHAGTRRATRAEETTEAEEDYEGNDRRGKKHGAETGRETDQETFTLGSQHTRSRHGSSTSMVGGAMEWF